MQIRFEQPGDEAGIRAVVTAAFPTSAEANLVDRLRDSSRLLLSAVAVDGDRIVGHAALSPVTVGGLSLAPPALGLAPVAVHPDRQRRGIGAQLIQFLLEACDAGRAPLVVVLGEPEYYRRFGFTTAAAAGLQNEYGVHAEFMSRQPPAMQHVELHGLVRYGSEFAEV